MGRKRLVVFTGAGMSAPSGISTFRDKGGLWEKYSIEEVATPGAWHRNLEKVLQFYNERRIQLSEVEPNAGHIALAGLEKQFDVVVVTQNVDNLHERGGSSRVIHLHGELTKVRSVKDASCIYDIGTESIAVGDVCEKGGQLRPHIVWFGEQPHFMKEAVFYISHADILIVAGTSLQVYPAAGLLEYVGGDALKYLVDVIGENVPADFIFLQGSVDKVLAQLAVQLCN